MDRISRWLLLASRLLVGLLFVFSGIIKVNDLTGFLLKLEEYLLVLEGDLKLGVFRDLLPHVLPIGWGIAVGETLLGILLLLGSLRWLTTALLALLMILFTLLTGYSAVTGAVTDCGCFGDVLAISPWISFGKDVLLLFLAFFLMVYREDIIPIFKKKAIGYGVGLLAGLALYLATYTFYNHLPLVDFLPYAVGEHLPTNLEPSADGLPKAKDYIPAKAKCGTSELEGSALLVVSYALEAADTSQLRRGIELGNALKTTDIHPYLLTASVKEVRDSLVKQYAPTFCTVVQDQTVLKTMVRANPGFLLLHNGTIVGKWHGNDLPTEAQLRAKLP